LRHGYSIEQSSSAGNTAALRQQEDLWDDQWADQWGEGSELIDLSIEIARNEQPFCALSEAKQRYHDLIRFAAQWDARIAAERNARNA
jgi:hypothetical protein